MHPPELELHSASPPGLVYLPCTSVPLLWAFLSVLAVRRISKLQRINRRRRSKSRRPPPFLGFGGHPCRRAKSHQAAPEPEIRHSWLDLTPFRHWHVNEGPAQKTRQLAVVCHTFC